jgi:hypothetical protein
VSDSAVMPRADFQSGIGGPRVHDDDFVAPSEARKTTLDGCGLVFANDECGDAGHERGDCRRRAVLRNERNSAARCWEASTSSCQALSFVSMSRADSNKSSREAGELMRGKAMRSTAPLPPMQGIRHSNAADAQKPSGAGPTSSGPPGPFANDRLRERAPG